ncbi:MAG: hypothetical protein JXB23_10970 [Candidatus Aminicenantes bacterium]|nr:hypothetical protein [Candidatus Aminicenantes bacterium]
MACVNPDGTVSETAKALLRILNNPLMPEDISKQLGQPLFKVRSSLREMAAAEFIKEQDGKYIITEKGKEKI